MDAAEPVQPQSGFLRYQGMRSYDVDDGGHGDQSVFDEHEYVNRGGDDESLHWLDRKKYAPASVQMQEKLMQ